MHYDTGESIVSVEAGTIMVSVFLVYESGEVNLACEILFIILGGNLNG